MNDPASTIATFLGQIVVALAGMSALIFWRGTACGQTLTAIGRIKRLARITPLTPRVRQLLSCYYIRLLLFCGFLLLLFLCCMAFLLSVLLRGTVVGVLPPDPGLAEIVIGKIASLVFASLVLLPIASLLMFSEWLVDCSCQYLDLEASLAILDIRGCVERPETTFLQLERYDDLLTLWQARIRYCVENHAAAELGALFEELVEADMSWSRFSKIVCGFRVMAMSNPSISPRKQLPSDGRNGPT